MQHMKFKAKVGFCHIYKGHIVFTKQEEVDSLDNVKPPYNKKASLIMAFVLIGSMIYFFIHAKMSNDASGMGLSAVLCSFSIYLALNIFKNSNQAVIRRENITSMRFIKGINGVTRTRFEVEFTDDNGNPAKSLIVLPGTLANGKENNQRSRANHEKGIS